MAAARSRTSFRKTVTADGMAVTSVYFDAALVAKFYVNEPGRDAVRALAREMGRVVTSGIAVAEVSAAFHRKLREGSVDHDVFDALMGQLSRISRAASGLWRGHRRSCSGKFRRSSRP